MQIYLAQTLGREATDSELAIATNDTAENIRSARRMMSTEVSLDAPVEQPDRSGTSAFGERVAGVGSGEIEETTRRRPAARVHRAPLPALPDAAGAADSLLYYGLDEGSEALTLEQIGALLGVTRERIRQIRERAFEKLRRSADIRALHGYRGAA